MLSRLHVKSVHQLHGLLHHIAHLVMLPKRSLACCQLRPAALPQLLLRRAPLLNAATALRALCMIVVVIFVAIAGAAAYIAAAP